MSWFKKSIIQQLKENEARQKEYDAIPIAGKATSERTASNEQRANSARMEKIRKERDEKEKAEDGQKLVIDMAKIECKLCTNPQGLLKVNFDTPSVQGKKTATVKETNMKSLIFMGNCTKSPNSSSPCASVMQLGEWKDVGTLKVQEEFPLLLKSTIPCNYGGAVIEIKDCGQRNEPSNLDTVGMPVPENEEIITVNGHYYNINGTFEGKIDENENEGSVNDVYTCSSKEKKLDKNSKEVEVYKDIELLKENDVNITHSDFCYIAYVVKMEAGEADLRELKCIAYASFNRSNTKKTSWKKLLTTSYSSVGNKKELSDNNIDKKSKLTRQALFSVLKSEEDITDGAEFWDGTDFLAWGNSETNPYNKHGQNKFDEYKFIEIPKNIYDDFVEANGSSARYSDKGNHKEKDDVGIHEHIKKKIKKKILGKDGKPVLGKDGKPTYEEVEVPNKIKYPIPATDFENQDYWISGSFYYETGIKATNGISGTITAGKSIFWKLTTKRLTSATPTKK
ncbi:PAAR-like protein [uncultured Flavobacterium sp.]|uniref:PAAR-like protein n=1 Tax=uncultured Flavobacterium sp. TaxID=165435 RepID=UPI0025E072A0|nr:PAAR-like protein [uncultured Flavobacterium sp.]